MHLADLTLASFLCLGTIRCLSYVPQIVCIARDQNGASAISYTTWCTWTLANLTTAAYAGLNLGDPYLAAISCVYALGCAIVVSLTVIKRAQHRKRRRTASLLTVPVDGVRADRGSFGREPARLKDRDCTERPPIVGSLSYAAAANT